MIFYLHCFDIGGGAQEEHPVCKKLDVDGGGDDLTVALRDL